MTYELHLGDCLDFMRTMPAGSVDAVITDPPYGVTGEEEFGAVETVLSSLSWECAAIILDWRNPIRGPRKIGELVWEYGWVSGFRSKAKSGVCHTHNTIHLLGDPKRFHFTDGSFIERQPGFSSPLQTSFANKSGHPYEKPVKLMAHLIERIDAQTIFDPFMGSGTTGVACMQLGRNFIGCEISEQYFNIAKKRIEAASLQPQLFQEKKNGLQEAQLHIPFAPKCESDGNSRKKCRKRKFRKRCNYD